MRVRIEVIDTAAHPALETQDFPDLDPGQVTMFTASLLGTVQAATEFLSWGRDKPVVLAGAAGVADELYSRLRVGIEAEEGGTQPGADSEGSEPAKMQAPKIQREVVKAGTTNALLLKPIQPVRSRNSGLITIGAV